MLYILRVWNIGDEQNLMLEVQQSSAIPRNDPTRNYHQRTVQIRLHTLSQSTF